MATKHQVWVYGTLRPSLGEAGGWNAERMLGPNYPSESATAPGHLFSLGPYPAMLYDPKGQPVVGEIITVDGDQLEALDYLEGLHPGERVGRTYQRTLIEVTKADGTRTWAWAYTGTTRFARRATLPRIEGGDWGAFYRQREAERG